MLCNACNIHHTHMGPVRCRTRAKTFLELTQRLVNSISLHNSGLLLTLFPDHLCQLRPLLASFPGFDCWPHPHEGCRLLHASFPVPPSPDPSVATVENVVIAGPDGHPLRLLVVKPCLNGSFTVGKRRAGLRACLSRILIRRSLISMYYRW
jgi:hypothetical protein